MVTMGSYEKSLKVTMGGRRPDAYDKAAVYSAKIATTALMGVTAIAGGLYSYLHGVRAGPILALMGVFTAWLVVKDAKGRYDGRGIDPNHKVGLMPTLWVSFLAVMMVLDLCLLVYLWITTRT
jgi:hypothetical protein